MPKKVKFYKEPVFLFTSGSLRFAAWAGWYSALGDAEQSERWAHQARAEWMKEVGAGRRFALLGRHNHDMYNYISPERFRDIFNTFLRTLQQEIRKGKKTSNR
ncbi:hypothetical protein A3B21_05195 [Candidatus Uhrbacteria bacterium RIFCSPLOWO2_01_FULL_47_24]|uniref:Uncharacterized protein n=1 Tax=Candidatus Uhrbacteria bacterium RIFCSPLOWO2_01_FULL_47_24 TaxID=1802401 RepID=A0A1F7UUY7_9BACT|nr:MAG: hypothetical protein A2753_03230 [Candidatus Uhrbacteria bacterium RIFCSPHIGHO2_01_FULL_47_11]OGL69343.1 MAG: hypothetical protein A3D58_03580 [Candidatus Uhrbacteria bacterium RIFCSPHIGHO2_02_FULL_46_47]OGL75862.1 MAG: hypothetical protein A3F52_03455 [Candidatus Uhrbacteria bacterium RIFCSPHIGHO2_12_FULL_47_11]OGL82079.1 MAG: hypothetical protein A3B21_05195 [Candidatus Uhrbacteria bacterium RIFCSPLOWO2_01_FULL_47_24]OGL85474.1 MAG: hypothetical protein A3J03_05365 [Candidatus Uhrbact